MQALEVSPRGVQPLWSAHCMLRTNNRQGQVRPSWETLQKNNISPNEISGWSLFPGREGRRKIFIKRVVATEKLASSQLQGPFLCMSFFCEQICVHLNGASLNVNINKCINLMNI